MSWQHVELNMIPGGELPVVHVSQFDTLRAFHFDLKVGEDDWTIPEGIHFELHCRKVDDNIVIIAPDSTDTSSVTFTTTEQLTACSGKNECELVAIDDEDDSLIIGSINFILDVEADPLAGGLNSETAIYNLTVQIEDIISSEGYLKSDDVSPVALTGSYNDLTDKPTIPDMSNYYTKSETYNKTQVDDALSLKANTAELATVATTGNYDDLTNKPTIPAAQVNSDWNAVSGVAEILNKPTIPTNTSDLNNDSDFQNETEVNNLIAEALLAVMPVDTETGNPCSFDTDIATSLVRLSAEITASGGGGTPSTPIPIVGISSLEITANGTTFTIDLGGTRYGGVYTADGKLRVTHRIDIVPTINDFYNSGSHQYTIFTPTEIKNALSREWDIQSEVIIPREGESLGDFFNIYHGSTTCFIGVTDAYTVAEFNSEIAGTNIRYELATPIEIDVSAISVNAISGVNNISSNGNGDVTAQYKVSIQKYIDDHV